MLTRKLHIERTCDYLEDGIRGNHNEHADDAPEHVALAVLCALTYAVLAGQKLNNTENKHDESRSKYERQNRVDDDVRELIDELVDSHPKLVAALVDRY